MVSKSRKVIELGSGKPLTRKEIYFGTTLVALTVAVAVVVVVFVSIL